MIVGRQLLTQVSSHFVIILHDDKLTGGARLFPVVTVTITFIDFHCLDRADRLLLGSLCGKALQFFGTAQHHPIGLLPLLVLFIVNKLDEWTDDERHRSANLVGNKCQCLYLLSAAYPEVEQRGYCDDNKTYETLYPQTPPPRMSHLYAHLLCFRTPSVVFHRIPKFVDTSIKVAERHNMSSVGDGDPVSTIHRVTISTLGRTVNFCSRDLYTE